MGLVITRFPGECFVIDNRTAVKVIAVRGDKVRLNVFAPREQPIWRGELCEATVSVLVGSLEEVRELNTALECGLLRGPVLPPGAFPGFVEFSASVDEAVRFAHFLPLRMRPHVELHFETAEPSRREMVSA